MVAVDAEKVDGRGDGDGPDKLARPTPATGESSRARSFARTHARNAIATETEIDFPAEGYG